MLKRVALAVVVGIGVVRGLAGCGSAQQVECRVAAVSFLPEDPMAVTPYDVQDLVGRLNACKQGPGDAGR
jgi:hypothetical protein